MYPPLKMSHIPKNKKKALNPLSKIMMMIKKHLQLMFKLKLSLMINFEPLKVHEALVDPDWVIAMQEELECFTRNEVWSLVERPKDHRINVIGTKWVFKNKQDEDGIVIRNKARKFEMSMMGELKFFLGFQVRQLAKGTFISQEKYVKDMLKKFNMTNASPMKTPMPVKGQLGSCDGSWSGESETRGNVSKRGRANPPRRASNRVPPPAQQGTDGGSSVGGRTKSVATKHKDKHVAQEDDEVVPTVNVGAANRLEWKAWRTVNPYRFAKPTYTRSDKAFWTNTQAVLWEGYYDSHEYMKHGNIVSPKAINPAELALHEATKYRFVVQTLKNLGVYDLVCLKPDETQDDPTYCPLLVRQFHCTVFFHDDEDRTLTWMTGKTKYSCTYSQFRAAMGCGDDTGPPTISGMYYSYLVLAKLFRENLISKSGDSSEVRNYHLNLMYYCHPDRETRRRQNEFMATRNVTVPPPGPELAPVAAPQWEMPSITDEMIQNFDFSMYAHGGLPPRTARTPTPPPADDDGDEDEVDSAAGDDDEGSYSTGHEFY
ncbi:hypothetical protein QYE76_020448 [Lolium multiflorum]|uniref:Reverse transcriptase Ty1/copia-type domain-containing protein n=1 Tax=Lolium multiflorum TaxID=4521 RepID=A0AAD8VRC2_LOLMU|nr:hypothetical protein QYE76_020448 [Lolium multiflorum]